MTYSGYFSSVCSDTVRQRTMARNYIIRSHFDFIQSMVNLAALWAHDEVDERTLIPFMVTVLLYTLSTNVNDDITLKEIGCEKSEFVNERQVQQNMALILQNKLMAFTHETPMTMVQRLLMNGEKTEMEQMQLRIAQCILIFASFTPAYFCYRADTLAAAAIYLMQQKMKLQDTLFAEHKGVRDNAVLYPVVKNIAHEFDTYIQHSMKNNTFEIAHCIVQWFGIMSCTQSSDLASCTKRVHDILIS